MASKPIVSRGPLSYQQCSSAGFLPVGARDAGGRRGCSPAAGERARRTVGRDVALEHLFQGSALNAVDAKGRVSVPAFLRSVLERRGDSKIIVLAKHESFPCLSAYDPGYAALKHRKLERLLEKEETNPDADMAYQQRNLLAFAASEEVPYDTSGRIVIPPLM